MNRIAAVLFSCSALAAAGCGSADSTVTGQTQTIDLGAAQNVELFVPDGWYLENMSVTGTVADTEEDTIYVMADREQLPPETLTGGATDPDLRDEFTRLAVQGAALSVLFTPLGSCAEIETQLGQARADFEKDVTDLAVEELNGVLGNTASLGSGRNAGAASGAPDAAVWLHGVVPLGNAECAGLLIQKFSSADTIDADRQQLTAIATKSVLTD